MTNISNILFSVDGGLTWNTSSEGVRVLFLNVDLPDERVGDLIFNVTSEGLITELRTTSPGDSLHAIKDNDVYITSSELVEDIVLELVNSPQG